MHEIQLQLKNFSFSESLLLSLSKLQALFCLITHKALIAASSIEPFVPESKDNDFAPYSLTHSLPPFLFKI